jgi:uncharacterized protein
MFPESEEVILGPTDDAISAPEEAPRMQSSATVAASVAAKNKISDEKAKRQKMGASVVDAARTGDLEVMKRLVEEEDCDVDEKVIGCTPLHYAVFYNNMAVVEYLVSQSVQLNQMDLSGLTALAWAVERQNLPLVRYLLECQAHADIRDNTGATALHKAVLKGNMGIVRALVELGHANVNIKTKEEAGANTPLHEASASGALDVVAYLLDHGADPLAKNAQGRTPLYRAVVKNKVDVVRLLVQRGADVNQADSVGRAVLHWAAFYGFEELVATLLELGASVVLRDKTGANALDIAKRREFARIVMMLSPPPAAA